MNTKSITFIFITISIVTFMLGSWQLYRLNWKNNLISNISASINNPELYKPEKFYENLTSVKLDDNYKIVNQPVFIESKTFKGNPGYHLISPIKLNGQFFSIVNFGWVKEKDLLDTQNIFEKYSSLDYISVYLRDFHSDKAFFTPQNDLIKNIWYSVNKTDMNRYYESSFKSEYYFVLLDERVNKFIHNPLVFLRNNHLNYSITWFLLSLSSLTMLLIIRKKNG